ncbi:MAG: 50S ribosomal protein L31e [Candidatus Nanoarchaeia archaeon]
MVEEIVYNVPLRRDFLKASKWRRAEKAITVLRNFVKKHTKAKVVKLSKWINQQIWARGSKYPPAKLSIKVLLDKDKSVANVDLLELPKEAKKEVKKEAAKKEKEVKVEKKEETKVTKEKSEETKIEPKINA